jgi:hypothetical protein
MIGWQFSEQKYICRTFNPLRVIHTGLLICFWRCFLFIHFNLILKRDLSSFWKRNNTMIEDNSWTIRILWIDHPIVLIDKLLWVNHVMQNICRNLGTFRSGSIDDLSLNLTCVVKKHCKVLHAELTWPTDAKVKRDLNETHKQLDGTTFKTYLVDLAPKKANEISRITERAINDFFKVGTAWISVLDSFLPLFTISAPNRLTRWPCTSMAEILHIHDKTSCEMLKERFLTASFTTLINFALIQGDCKKILWTESSTICAFALIEFFSAQGISLLKQRLQCTDRSDWRGRRSRRGPPNEIF